MDSEQLKLQTLLKKLLDSNFVIKDSRLKNLLNLIKKEETNTSTLTKNSRIYITWMHNILEKWKLEEPNTQHICILLELIAVFCKDKLKFLIIHKDNIISQTINALKSIQNCEDERVNLAYIKMLNALMETTFGRDWLITSYSCWNNIFDIYGKCRTPALTEALGKFLGDLYLKVAPTNKLFFIDISQIMLKPLYDFSESDSDSDLQQQLSPTLCLLNELCIYLSAVIVSFSQYIVIYNRLFSLQTMLYSLLKTTRDEKLSLELSQVLMPIHFLEAGDYIQSTRQDCRPKYVKTLIRPIQINTQRVFIENVMKLCRLSQIYWKSICRLVGSYEYAFYIEKELLLVQMMPIVEMDFRFLGSNALEKWENDEIRDLYCDDLCIGSDLSFIRLWYEMREMLTGKPSIAQEALWSIQYIIKTKPLYSKQSIIIILKFWVYLVSDLADNINKTGDITEYERFLSYYLDSFITCVEDFQFSWKDGIEIVQVLPRILDFLQILELPSQLVVKALKLVEISISRYLSPNLALLVDSNDSTMTYMGPLLYAKLLDSNWEVRNQSLKVLFTISEKAKKKFPYFQKILLDSDLHKTIIKIVYSKDEPPIRTNAVKCLQQVVMVDEIWTDLLNIPDIQERLISMLKSEPDEIIRSEIIKLVTIIYEEEHLSPDIIKEVYSILSNLEILSYSVNIRINTLKFWDIVIKKHFYENGMIDNEFPEVTFSKSLRKIVVLDKMEIIKRIKTLMQILSNIGCLSVLEEMSKSVNSKERELAQRINNEITLILERYNVNIDSFSGSESTRSIPSSASDFELYEDDLKNEINVEYVNFIPEDFSADMYPDVLSPKELLVNENSSFIEENNSLEYRNELILLLDDILEPVATEVQ